MSRLKAQGWKGLDWGHGSSHKSQGESQGAQWGIEGWETTHHTEGRWDTRCFSKILADEAKEQEEVIAIVAVEVVGGDDAMDAGQTDQGHEDEVIIAP